MKLEPHCQHENHSAKYVNFTDVKIAHKFGEITLNESVEYSWGMQNSRFSINISLYLENGRR